MINIRPFLPTKQQDILTKGCPNLALNFLEVQWHDRYLCNLPGRGGERGVESILGTNC